MQARLTPSQSPVEVSMDSSELFVKLHHHAVPAKRYSDSGMFVPKSYL